MFFFFFSLFKCLKRTQRLFTSSFALSTIELFIYSARLKLNCPAAILRYRTPFISLYARLATNCKLYTERIHLDTSAIPWMEVKVPSCRDNCSSLSLSSALSPSLSSLRSFLHSSIFRFIPLQFSAPLRK